MHVEGDRKNLGLAKKVTISKKIYNFCSILMKLSQSDYLKSYLVIWTKFHENRTKTVDFLLIVTFLVNLNNFWAPSTLYFLKPLTFFCLDKRGQECSCTFSL